MENVLIVSRIWKTHKPTSLAMTQLINSYFDSQFMNRLLVMNRRLVKKQVKQHLVLHGGFSSFMKKLVDFWK